MKRLITGIIILAFILYGLQVFAENSAVMTYDMAKTNLIKYNDTLKKLHNIETQAYLQYKDVDDLSRGINTKGVTINDNLYEFDGYTQMLLTKQKELMPEQMKNAWDMAKNNSQITENSLVVTLRNVYLAFASSESEQKSKQSLFILAENTWKTNKQKFAKGMLTSEDADQSDYDYFKAKLDLDAAKRNRENSLRSLNSLIGTNIGTDYSGIELKETINNGVKAIDYYISKAMSKRQEIVSIQNDIQFKQHELQIVEKDKVYLTYPAADKERKDILFDIDILKAKLDKTKYDLEQEIKNSYIDVSKLRGSMNTLENTLDSQKRNLQKVTAQYKKGLITSNAVELLQISVTQTESAYNATIFNYNTAVMKLENSAGLGPAYTNK